MSEYNLLDEKWILVFDNQHELMELSLLDVFKNAGKIACLANELPTLDVAILRLLLAIMHASLTEEVRDYSDGINLWRELWENGLPFGKISSYLEKWRDRFYLFDDKYPFYQVAFAELPQGITFTYKTANNLNGEIAEADRETPNMFAGRKDRSKLTYAEAARWLIHLNSFDIAPAGTPGKPPIRIKGYGVGYLSKIGLLWLTGDNLFQTMMLNLVLLDKDGNPWMECKPYWETYRPLVEDQLKKFERLWPNNLPELYTIPWRRVKLISSADDVTGYELWGGCSMKTENGFIEPMTMWKQDDNGNYKPLLHNSSRQLWRDFAALSVKDTQDARPMIVSWASEIIESGIELPIFRFRSASITYIKNTKVGDLFSDSLSFNAEMLSKVGIAWIPRICDALISTKQAVSSVGMLAMELAEAAGDKRDEKGKPSASMYGKSNAAKSEAYFRLDEPFREWLSNINPKNDKIPYRLDEWREIAYRMLLEYGKEIVAQVGITAFVGKISLKNGSKTPINSSIAFNRFKLKIYKILKKEDVNDEEQRGLQCGKEPDNEN